MIAYRVIDIPRLWSLRIVVLALAVSVLVAAALVLVGWLEDRELHHRRPNAGERGRHGSKDSTSELGHAA